MEHKKTAAIRSGNLIKVGSEREGWRPYGLR